MPVDKRTVRVRYTVVAFLLAAVLAIIATLGLLERDALAAAPVAGPGSQPASAAKPFVPNVGVWTDIAPFPTATTSPTPAPSSLRLKRAGAACYAPNGKCYVLGGRHGTDGEDLTLRYIWEYTPGNPGSYVLKTALLDTDAFVTRYTANMAVAVLTDTSGPRIYAIGGSTLDSNITGQVRAYNPVADAITTITTDPWPANPPRIPGGYAVVDNNMYIFGGFSSLVNGGTGGVFTDTWRFNPLGPAGSKWTQIPSANLSLGRAYIAGAALDGKIYAIGGDTWNPTTRQLVPQSIVERLDLAQLNPTWAPVASLPSPRGDLGAWAYEAGTGYEISGNIVVAGGVFPVPDAKAYRYDPNTGSWSDFVALLHPTRNYGVAQLNGTLYAFGGYDYRNNIPSGANFSQRYDATGATPTPTNTPVFSPTATATPFSTNYNVCAFTGVSIVQGTSLVAGSQCDDCIVTVTLPFPYTLYDQTFTTVQLSSNGTMGFVFPEGNPVNYCLPSVTAISAIFGFWDDLVTTGAGCPASCGIYTSVTGSAPNRIYNIEWRATRSNASGGGYVNFEIRLYEGQPQFDIVYGSVAGGGNTATVGVQRDRGSLFTQYTCNTVNLSNGTQLLFTLVGGICPTFTPTFTPSITPTPTYTVTGTPPTATPTPCSNTDYLVSSSTGATIDPGSLDTGNHCDDCTDNIVLPFQYNLYDLTFNTANVSSNGNLQFGSTSNAFTNGCLPQSGIDTAIFAYWDDLRTDTGTGCGIYSTGCGIYTSVSGSTPNRIFNVEWRTVLYNPATSSANFEVRLYEGQSRFDIVYGQVDAAGTSATVGVQRDTGSRFTQFECNTGGLSLGLKLTADFPPCGTATPTFTGTPPTATPTRTITPSFTRTNTPTITGTSTPAATCGPGADYVFAQSSGAAIDPGVNDIGNHADDLVTAITLPFPVQLYGQSFTSANVSSNGLIQFNSSSAAFANTCLPANVFDTIIMAFWDDLDTRGTGNGIFTSIVGTAPNRIFNVEWRVFYINTSTFLNFEIRLYENQDRFDCVYGVIPDGGVSATVGVQRGVGSSFTQFSCNTNSIVQGLQLSFTAPPCGTPTPTFTGTPPTSIPTFTPTVVPTATCILVDYVINQSTGASIVLGLDDIGNHTDDGVTTITLPFSVQLYAQLFTTMNVSSNGNIQFNSSSIAFTNVCLPANVFNNVILAQWDDLRTDQLGSCTSYGGVGCGIFTSVSGTAPNRIFNIEWRAVYFGNTAQLANFEVRMYEGVDQLDIIFGQVDQTGTGATVGVQRDTGSRFTQFECDSGGAAQGLRLMFYMLHCDSVTSTPTPTSSPTSTSTLTPTPNPVLVGHVTWQGPPPQPNALQQLPITLTLKSGSTEVNYPAQTTDATGHFTVSVASLPAGSYAWRVKGSKWLANSGLVTLPGGPTTLEAGLLRAGDCDNNNIVNLLDFNIMKATFGSSIGDPNYDDRADFDGNQTVNVADFNLVRQNFGQAGAPPVRP